MGRQLDLFADESTRPELDTREDADLMSRVPAWVRLGTSSWTFPGWGGLVYAGTPSERQLVERGLEEYARHPLFRTVGIDRSYYRPLDAGTLDRYAGQLPGGFRCVSKVLGAITSPVDPRTRSPSAHYLNVELFERDVLQPLADRFRDHLGPLVFEFAPLRGSEVPDERTFASELDDFFARLPPDFDYAVELRNRELLSPRHLDVLAKHGVGHVLNFWEQMPTLGAQLDRGAIRESAAPFVVCRLLLPPGKRYEARKQELAPFDRIVDEQTEMRFDVVRVFEACEALGKVLYIIVNNKAEGSSPLTVRALARAIAERPAEPPP